MESTPTHIDPRIYALYDEYCHGRIDRREFMKRASALTVAGGGVPPGSHGAAGSVDPAPVLRELARRGVRSAAFVGV